VAKIRLLKFNKKLAAIIVAILLLLLAVIALAWDQFGPEPESQPTEQPEESQETPPVEEGALITKVSVSVSPSTYSSTSCSKAFKFTGKITASREGTVKYYWEKSNGGKSTSQTVKFTKAETKSVSYSWTVNGDYSGWARLKTTSPETLTSSKASFTETCVFAVTSVTASVSPSTNNSCPTETYNFTGKITVNEAGTVKYKWERAYDEDFDGSIETLSSTSTNNLTFTKAGTKTVSRSDDYGLEIVYAPDSSIFSRFLVWLRNLFSPVVNAIFYPPDGQEGWERIKVTSPNSKTSNKAEFTYDMSNCL